MELGVLGYTLGSPIQSDSEATRAFSKTCIKLCWFLKVGYGWVPLGFQKVSQAQDFHPNPEEVAWESLDLLPTWLLIIPVHETHSSIRFITETDFVNTAPLGSGLGGKG